MTDRSINADANLAKNDLKIEFQMQDVMIFSGMFEVTSVSFSGYRLRIFTEYASCTEAFRKLPLPADLVVWTMPPGFLGAYWWGERRDGVLGPRGRGSSEEWKGSTGKWASLCRSRATRHAPRLPSSSLRWGLLFGPSKESKGDRSSKKEKPDRVARTDRAPRS